MSRSLSDDEQRTWDAIVAVAAIVREERTRDRTEPTELDAQVEQDERARYQAEGG